MATIGTSHTMPIPFNGANTYVNFEKLYFNDMLAYFATDNEKLQEAIEASKFFKSKEIRITGTIEPVEEVEAEQVEEQAPDAEAPAEQVEEQPALVASSEAPAPAVEEAKAPEAPKSIVNDEVTKFQDAKKILTSEPYKVPFQALSTPEKILKKAAELGITFTNLHLPE